MLTQSPSRHAPFIVIEGLDRSGKSTQTFKLHSRLKDNGIEASLITFPDRTTAIGQMIDSYLRSASGLDDHAIHLLFSANRWEFSSVIEKSLISGIPIICDRYAFSGIAFSAAKINSDGKPLIPFEWCRSPDIGLPAPDIVLFFDITPEKAKERGGYGEERYEREEMQLHVRKFFHQIGEEIMRGESGTQWISIDAGRARNEVEQDVWRVIQPLLEGVEGPVRKLWTSS